MACSYDRNNWKSDGPKCVEYSRRYDSLFLDVFLCLLSSNHLIERRFIVRYKRIKENSFPIPPATENYFLRMKNNFWGGSSRFPLFLLPSKFCILSIFYAPLLITYKMASQLGMRSITFFSEPIHQNGLCNQTL